MVFVMMAVGVMVVADVVGIVVRVRVLVVTLFAVEDQEVHAERIKRSHKNTGQDRKMGKSSCRQMALGHRLNDAVLGIKA